MRVLRKFKIDKNGGMLSAYVMILLGLIVMLSLFGFQTAWDVYTDTAVLTDADTPANADETDTITETTTPVTDTELNIGKKLFDMLTSSIYSMLIGGAGIAVTVGFLILFRKNQAIWQYILPLILLVVLNIFVFPIYAIKGDLQPLDAVGIGFTGFFMLFFNLFYILAVLEFVRGGST